MADDKKEKTSTDVSVIGIAEYAKLFFENRDKIGYKATPESVGAFEECGGAYTVDLYLDDENKEALMKAGSGKEPELMKDGDHKGLWKVKVVRKHENRFKNYGGPPVVVHADGQTPFTLEEDGLIGNGSKVAAGLAIFPAGRNNGTRLNWVQVIDHIPYESDFTPGYEIPNRAEPTPDKPKATKSKAKKEAEPVLDDEIPF